MKKDPIIDKIIDSGLVESASAIVIGLSGGPDSLCLLHALSSISDALDLILVPVHINHMLRPEAEAEADHAADICERLDLECKVFEAPCRQIAEEAGLSIEEAGRQLRYQVYDDAASELEEQGIPRDRIFIALGHNADDQAETVLFRLIRGTGPRGLAGIPSFRFSEKGYAIIRPLLEAERTEIEAYIKENRLRPNLDKTNNENTYARNRIRNELIPYLEKNYNPQIKSHLRRYAALAADDNVLLNEVAFAKYKENVSTDEDNWKVTLDISELRDDPLPITSRVVNIVFSHIGIDHLTTYENVSAVTRLLYSSKPSCSIDLPLGIRAKREYDRLIFSYEEPDIQPDIGLQIYPQIVMIKDFFPDEDSPYAAFDFDKFSEEYPGRLGDLILRTRREGDCLPMKKGSKKIQDLMVDSKIRKAARGSMLMLCIGSEVMWVLPSDEFPGEREKTKGRFTSKYRIDETTRRVLLVELVESL